MPENGSAPARSGLPSDAGVLVPLSVVVAVDRMLRIGVREMRRDGESLEPEVVKVVASVAWWAASLRGDRIAASGSGMTADCGNRAMVLGTSSASRVRIGSREVAAMLGLQERRVRQIASLLGGECRAGRWEFDPEKVAAYHAERCGECV